MIPKWNDPNIMRWFRNVRSGDSFDSSAISTDYNLQISAGIQRFLEWKQTQAGFFASPPPAAQPQVGMPTPVDAERETLVINRQKVFRVTRE